MVEISSTIIPATAVIRTADRRCVKMPLNIMITPQIADNTIAFIIYNLFPYGCLVIIFDKIMSTVDCVISSIGFG